MNFDDAIKAHSDWKQKLSAYLKHPNHSIVPSLLGKDNLCPLGQWLHGEGKTLCGNKPEYQELVKVHAEFHKAAASIVEKKDRGENISEELALGSNSPYVKTSQNVISLINKLKLICEKK